MLSSETFTEASLDRLTDRHELKSLSREMAESMADAVIGERIRQLFECRGSSRYGGECVNQLEHALQAASLAEADGAEPELIVAALLHDVGHLLHDLPNDAPDSRIDDVHEKLACEWLQDHFGPAVTQPVQLHVDAKRYLCAVDQDYEASLSLPSRQSLELQGGRFAPDDVRAFAEQPYYADAVRLRRWDDRAKVPGLRTPGIEHFLEFVHQVQLTTRFPP